MNEEIINQTAQIKKPKQEIKDYSEPFEKINAEVSKLKELKSRIAERLKFVETELVALELMEDPDSSASTDNIRKQCEILGGLYKEINKLNQEEYLAEKITTRKIAMLLEKHEVFTEILEDFHPRIEY